MRIDATPAEAQTILKAMRAVAGAGAAITAADRASIVAAARYIFQTELSPDLAGLVPPRPEELKALAAKPDLAAEAVRRPVHGQRHQRQPLVGQGLGRRSQRHGGRGHAHRARDASGRPAEDSSVGWKCSVSQYQ